ncbi:MAG: hypothetical protein UV54_C0053G0003 [Candidatus Beckwithbacteria bacterium GW2011_GWA2_43_10]|uniref:Uncharacterized protein n=1 Tax=Candidatus Beckwithbacteria bacterium GW2011_GWA2_43_10 TaxID=1618369 RepID=A0A0G1EVW9_9BACT|nr:MAG: hypothetical protein UV54_C0053G0003 [Candidatus Beckwithbacteria bacterium GW2011_GWA2_43_10]
MSYLILLVWTGILSLVFIKFVPSRLIVAVLMGISYLIWGIFTHRRNKTLYWPVVLEYFAIGLLATTVLIFISLRA